MVESPKFKGFTLLELIVAMAIIAVLIGLSLLGIQTVQRSSRDTQRRSAVQGINLEIQDYYGSKNSYPLTATVTVNAAGTAITVGTGGKVVTLTGAQVDDKTNITAAPWYGPTGSRYCYTGTATTYSIGVYLESGTPFDLGTPGVDCTTGSPSAL